MNSVHKTTRNTVFAFSAHSGLDPRSSAKALERGSRSLRNHKDQEAARAAFAALGLSDPSVREVEEVDGTVHELGAGLIVTLAEPGDGDARALFDLIAGSSSRRWLPLGAVDPGAPVFASYGAGSDEEGQTIWDRLVVRGPRVERSR